MKSCVQLFAGPPFRMYSVLLFVILLFQGTAFAPFALAQHKKIAIFGSSVAKGSGDTTGTGGYAGMIKNMLEQRGWTVVNVSRGGDNTTKILPRFEKELLPEKPDYVIIGLSLGNEGITSSSKLNRERVYERFRSGMLHLINLCRNNGMIPVVVNCYARNDFGEDQYEAIRRMNMQINSWEVPGINALGAIDNGNGKWADGYWHDKSHPNEKGHREIFYSFVPGLFDALAAGKNSPEKIRSSRYLSVIAGTSARPLAFTPEDTIHSFTVSFLVKGRDDGTIAAIHGKNTCAYFSLVQGRVVYSTPGGIILAADTSNENKGWQYVVLSYRQATNQTTYYLNGKLAGMNIGPLNLTEFILGGSGNETIPSPGVAGYKELMIYRSALNPDEVQALYYDQLLQSSLEVYAPLNDLEFPGGSFVKNYAQSTSKMLINGEHLVSVIEENGTAAK